MLKAISRAADLCLLSLSMEIPPPLFGVGEIPRERTFPHSGQAHPRVPPSPLTKNSSALVVLAGPAWSGSWNNTVSWLGTVQGMEPHWSGKKPGLSDCGLFLLAQAKVALG